MRLSFFKNSTQKRLLQEAHNVRLIFIAASGPEFQSKGDFCSTQAQAAPVPKAKGTGAQAA
jgi:hypothetical protein